MTDVEKRLTVALRGVAEDAPHAAGLAEAARVPGEPGAAGVRPLAVAAASIAVLVAVVGIGRGSGTVTGAPTDRWPDDPTATTGAPIGIPVHTETLARHRGAGPVRWGYGALSTWCLSGATRRPRWSNDPTGCAR